MSDKIKTGDILDEMTKEEMAAWIRQNCYFRMPKKSQLLFERWKARSAAVLDAEQKETEKFASIDVKSRDDLARQFNASTDSHEKLELLKKIGVYDDQVRDHFEARKVLDKKQKQLDKLYEQIDIERQKEQARKKR